MTIEYSPRTPRTRIYTIVEHGTTQPLRIEVDGSGWVQITEEFLDQILTRAGFIETTKENA